MSTVYVKTQKGHDEIESRAHGLKTKTRRILILIDGTRDLAEVERLSLSDDTTLTEAIAQLVAEEYIALRS